MTISDDITLMGELDFVIDDCIYDIKCYKQSSM